MKLLFISKHLIMLAAIVCGGLPILVTMNAFAANESVTVQSRLFFQDGANATMYWVDMIAGDSPSMSTPRAVEGFPKLDTEKQSLVQMREASGMLMIGIRDEENGEFQSGWVLIDSGVREEVHGDHSHWHYDHAPVVRSSKLDDRQGNPAHLYCYDEIFYLANDQKGGFTRLDPSQIQESDDADAIRGKATFHVGGGGHITMAANDEVAVSTWVDGEGENAGRVDVTSLAPGGSSTIARSFKLGKSGLHGATSQSGKFFFAPSDGICWVEGTNLLKSAASQIKPRHIDLGKDGDIPRRTGSFTEHAGHVLFVTGKAGSTAMGIINAADADPEVQMVPISIHESSRAFGPVIATPRRKSPLAFVFHDHAKGIDAPNKATVFELDPNGDGDFSDVKIGGEIEVGKSDMAGHSGHHDMSVDGGGLFAWITNPGDQTLSVISLRDLNVVGTHELPGKPGRLVSIGGRGKKQ